MDASRFDALTRTLARRLPRRTMLLGLVSLLVPMGTPARAKAQSDFTFKPLLLPFPAGPGYLQNGGPDSNRHSDSDANALDVCQCTEDTWARVGQDVVLAPTDLTHVFSDPTDRNNVAGDARDFHFFEIATSSDQRLCLSFAHFERAEAPQTRDGAAFYPQGSTVGTVLDYRSPNGSSIPHIHMGLFTVPLGGNCESRPGRVSVAFEGDYALDGQTYAGGQNHSGPLTSHNVGDAEKPGGVWSNLSLDGDTLEIAAEAYPASSGGPEIAYVEFTLWWPDVGPRAGPWIVACQDSTASDGDIYSCTVNLAELGVTPGTVDVSFDVYDVQGNYRLAPNGVRDIEYGGGNESAEGCPAGKTRCGEECVNTNTNWWHCGQCNHLCGIVEICCGGVCGCDSTVIVPGWCMFADYICPE